MLGEGEGVFFLHYIADEYIRQSLESDKKNRGPVPQKILFKGKKKKKGSTLYHEDLNDIRYVFTCISEFSY